MNEIEKIARRLVRKCVSEVDGNFWFDRTKAAAIIKEVLASATKRAEEAEAKIVSMRAGCDSTIENYRKQEHELVKQIAEFERTVAGCRALIATLRT